MSDDTATTTAHASGPAPEPTLRDRVIDSIKTCYDPEIPVNIWELGLVYDVEVSEAGEVAVRMTLTSPMCPVAESLPPEVEQKIATVEGVSTAKVEVVWEPTWSPALMSEAAKLELNMM